MWEHEKEIFDIECDIDFEEANIRSSEELIREHRERIKRLIEEHEEGK